MSQQKKQSVPMQGYGHGGSLGFWVSITKQSLSGPCQCAQSLPGEQFVQALLGSARNLVSHLPSVLRFPLVIETSSLSSHLGVLMLPYDPFLPVTFITGI